jgi:hypothetical protein
MKLKKDQFEKMEFSIVAPVILNGLLSCIDSLSRTDGDFYHGRAAGHED